MGGITPESLPILRGKGEPLAEIAMHAVSQVFGEHGAVLLRGYASSTDGFAQLSSRFSTRFMSYPDAKARKMHDASARIQTVNLGSGPIPLHSELSHTPCQPEIGWLYCKAIECTGGETTLCDGARVVERMPAALRRRLERSSLRYRRPVREDELRMLCDATPGEGTMAAASRAGIESYYRSTPRGAYQDFSTPCFIPHKRSGKLAFCNNIIHNSRYSIWYLLGLSVTPARALVNKLGLKSFSPEPGFARVWFPRWGSGLPISREIVRQIMEVTRPLECDIRWQPGDVLLWDNRRYMHGRRAFSGQREILTRWGADYVAAS